MGYYSELAGEINNVIEMQKLLDKRDNHILWLREKLKNIAAMKDQPKARDVARQTLLDGMAGGFDWKRPDH